MLYIAVFVDFGRVQFLYANFSISIVRGLVNKGKPKKLALIAVARKLLVIACAILNSQKPYEENHISCYNKNSVKIA